MSSSSRSGSVSANSREMNPEPLSLWILGRTPLGKMATLSHTGSLSGEDGLYDAVFAQQAKYLAELEKLYKQVPVTR